MVETLTVGILVAIGGWVIKSIVGMYLRRRAIVGALLLDIQTRTTGWDTTQKFLEKLIDIDLKPGKSVPYTALFEPAQTTIFDALLSELISHLPDHFPNLSKIYAAFKEADQLLVGILRDISIWKGTGHTLSDEDIKYLRAKRDRIISYIAVFKKRDIKSLSDLPTDYRGVQGTEVVTGAI